MVSPPPGTDVTATLPAPLKIQTPESANWFPDKMPFSNCPISVLLNDPVAVLVVPVPAVVVAPTPVPVELVVPVVVVKTPDSLATYPYVPFRFAFVSGQD